MSSDPPLNAAPAAHDARSDRSPRREWRLFGRFTGVRWAAIAAVGIAAVTLLGAAAVALAQWAVAQPGFSDFLHDYPGEYALPAGAPIGIPSWLGWQHFFNAFLMVLIIRSGLQIRYEKRPPLLWSSRRDPKRKISIRLWLHQSLDLLWLANGAVFLVLLFSTGQWLRIVPTSLAVFPNAVSALIQYVSLDWPTENGWANYNALQQIAYFTTVFIAAPLATISGFRMSAMWPGKSVLLGRVIPLRFARKTHFPVMLYFLVFIIVHVFLVLATGALRNLNHMYASIGSTDPTLYTENWTGFWLFVASLVITAGAVLAARPILLAPIARRFGMVGR